MGLVVGRSGWRKSKRYVTSEMVFFFFLTSARKCIIPPNQSQIKKLKIKSCISSIVGCDIFMAFFYFLDREKKDIII